MNINVQNVEALRKIAAEHSVVFDLLCLVEAIDTKKKRERTEVDRRHLEEARHAIAYARLDRDSVAK